MKLIRLALATLILLSSPQISTDVSAGTATPPRKGNTHVVFLISEDPNNYEATRTIPIFATKLKEDHGFQVTVLQGRGPRNAFSFPGLEVLSGADLLVVFCRRVALPTHELRIIKEYLRAGKPVVGIRTANHAFSPNEPVDVGHEAWPEFVSDILGCENRGYGAEKFGTKVSIVPNMINHPILKGVKPSEWEGEGSIYLVAPLLDERATILLTGSAQQEVQPVAWTRKTEQNSRVFYTSLGYPSDFDKPQYVRLLVNGIFWAVNKKAK